MANPRAVSCQFCGGRYFRASLPFHFKACIARQEASRLGCPYCKKQFRRGELQDHLDQCCKTVSNRRGGGSKAGGSRGEGQRGCVVETSERPLHPSPPQHTTDTITQWGEVGEGEGRQACRVCGRKFSVHRISVHEGICCKVQHRATRRPYDAAKHRIQGVLSSNVDASVVLRSAKKPPGPSLPWHSNWRRKHRDLVSMLRSARLSPHSFSPSPPSTFPSSSSINRSRWGSLSRPAPSSPLKPHSSLPSSVFSRPLSSALPSRPPLRASPAPSPLTHPPPSVDGSQGVRGLRPHTAALGRRGASGTSVHGGAKRHGSVPNVGGFRGGSGKDGIVRPYTANTRETA